MDKVMSWLRSTADILFVLGYCVIAFLKLSFLGILRYEIKEMIQKIKLLQTELACSILGPESEQQQVNHFVFLFICLVVRFIIGESEREVGGKGCNNTIWEAINCVCVPKDRTAVRVNRSLSETNSGRVYRIFLGN